LSRTDQLRILYFAFILATVIYGVVAWAGTNQRIEAQSLADELRAPNTLALYGACVVVHVAAFLVTMRMHPRSRRFIVRWALLESVCVLGLIAAMLHGDWRLYLPPWILALLGFGRSFPNRHLQTLPGT
jgi:hypothetical protein